MMQSARFFDKLKEVQDLIRAACKRSGRYEREICLIAVTKGVSAYDISRFVKGIGVPDLGENRVQEAQEKMERIKGNVRWHLIGHLQSNKTARAVDLGFSLIQSVHSMELAQKLDVRAGINGRVQDILIEINIGREPQKFGYLPEQAQEAAAAIGRLKHLALQGLMCMTPQNLDPEQSRPFFRQAFQLWGRLGDQNTNFKILSMGMSQDFVIAIEEGATMVRVGRAIFG